MPTPRVEITREELLASLRFHGGVTGAVWDEFGTSKPTIYRRIKEFGITELEMKHGSIVEYLAKVKKIYEIIPLSLLAVPLDVGSGVTLDDVFVEPTARKMIYRGSPIDDFRRARRDLSRPKPDGRLSDDDFIGEFEFESMRFPEEEVRCEDVFKAIDEEESIVIVGEPGIGKTTLLRKMAVTLAESWTPARDVNEKRIVPIYIESKHLREFLSTARSSSKAAVLTTVLRRQLSWNDLSESLIGRILAGGNYYLLVDGLDELGDMSNRYEAIRLFSDRSGNERKPEKIVFSTRPVGYDPVPFLRSGFTQFTLQPFDDDRLHRFLTRWYKHRPPGWDTPEHASEDLWRRVQDRKDVLEIIRNPLLATITALIHRSRGTIPEDRIQLYDIAVQTFVECWVRGRRISPRVQSMVYSQHKNLLESIAWTIHASDEHKSTDAHSDEDSGKPSGTTDGRGLIGFKELDSVLKKEIDAKFADLSEDERGALRADLIRDYTYSIGILAEQGQDKEGLGIFGFVHRTFQEFLAGSRLYQMASADPEKSAGLSFFELITGDRLKDHRGLALIERAHWKVPMHLGFLHLPTAQKRLVIEKVRNRKQWMGRPDVLHWNLCEALSLYCEAHRDLADPDFDLDMLKELIDGLGHVTYSWRTKAEFRIAEIIREHSLVKHVPRIMPMIADLTERKGFIILSAYTDILNPDDPEHRTILDGFIDSKNPDARSAAVEAIGKLGTREDLPRVYQMLKDEDVEVAAGMAFEKLVTGEHLPRLYEMLKDKDFRVRRAAVEAFGKLGTREDLPRVYEMLKDQEYYVKGAAVEALAKIGSREDIPRVCEMLKDQHPYVGFCADKAFGKLVTREDLPRVYEMLKHGHSCVRRAAVEAIGKLGTREDLPRVYEMLKDKPFFVRSAAVEAIGKLGTREDLPRVYEMLTNESSYVRLAAVTSLGKLGTREDLPRVYEMLKDEHCDVRSAAVEAFIELLKRDVRPDGTRSSTDSPSYQDMLDAVFEMECADPDPDNPKWKNDGPVAVWPSTRPQ